MEQERTLAPPFPLSLRQLTSFPDPWDS